MCMFAHPLSVSRLRFLLIGPGTGLAPMRALLQEREFQAKQVHKGMKKVFSSPTNVLFFGCKNKNIDCIYREELEACV